MKILIWFSLFIVCIPSLIISPKESFSDTYKYYYPEYPPFQYPKDGKPAGIFPALLTEAFHRMGHELETINVPWARIMRMMKTGKTDIVPAFKTPEREKFMDFSNETFLEQPVAIFTRKDLDITYNGDLTQLSKYRVGIVLRISYGKVADEAIANGVLPKVEYAADGEQSVLQLVRNRVDLIILNTYGAYHILQKLGVSDQVKEIRPAVQITPTNLGFSKNRNLLPLRDSFDKVLVEMKRDGSYDRILSQFTLGGSH
jgi:polar amino acid transport system substrate-binding protein